MSRAEARPIHNQQGWVPRGPSAPKLLVYKSEKGIDPGLSRPFVPGSKGVLWSTVAVFACRPSHPAPDVIWSSWSEGGEGVMGSW